MRPRKHIKHRKLKRLVLDGVAEGHSKSLFRFVIYADALVLRTPVFEAVSKLQTVQKYSK